VKLKPDGSGLAYSTYLGGSNDDGVRGIAVDLTGSAYVTGNTNSSDFPTLNPFHDNGGVFVTKFAPNGGSLIYSTYFGGGGESANAIAVDSAQNAYIAGQAGAEASDERLPAANPIQQCSGYSSFVAVFGSNGSTLTYSTCLGGGNFDSA